MTTILFLSVPALGHMDFGGLSFLRTASRLADQGHQVAWGFTDERQRPQMEAFLASTGLERSRLGALTLKLLADRHEVLEGIRTLARDLSHGEVDLVVADRRCVGVSVACHLAGVPWAVVGSDGAAWEDTDELRGVSRHGDYGNPRMREICAELGVHDLYPLCCRSSYLASPYLSLSFLPAVFFAEEGRVALPPHAHFLGCSSEDLRPLLHGDKILVSFGNSLQGPARERLVAALHTLVVQGHPAVANAEILCLTGNPEQTEELGRYADTAFRFQTWQAYEFAFAGACLAIGHGGTAFLWQALKARLPVLVAAPAFGDQTFNADRIERLRLGLQLRLDELTPEALGSGILRLRHDQRFRHAVERFHRMLIAGGGVAAAARLLENLAVHRRPIAGCGEFPCCCPRF